MFLRSGPWEVLYAASELCGEREGACAFHLFNPFPIAQNVDSIIELKYWF